MKPHIKSMLLKMLYRNLQDARDSDEDELVIAVQDLINEVEANN